MASSKAVTRLRAVRMSKRVDKPSPKSTQSVFERLSPEMLVKFLSHLDASSLFSISHTNKLFYQLGSENPLWKKLYIADFGNNKKEKPKTGEHGVGYWKELYIKTVAQREMQKLKHLLGPISCCTGLPSQTEQALRNLCVTWELTVTDMSGCKSTLDVRCIDFFTSSVTMYFSEAGCFPNHEWISSLQLHGVRGLALSRPSLRLGKRSLMANLDIQSLTKCTQVVGQDQLVQLKLLQPGTIVGLWRDGGSVAFIMFTLHFYKLLERSTLGAYDWSYKEPIIQPPFDDIDPEYGLHGYQLHIVLHNNICKLMSESFPQLFCHRAQISDGWIQLTAISRTSSSQHIQLSWSPTLNWRSEVLGGTVENCCIMSLTLLDEFRKPFSCVTCPVSMELEKAPVSFDYDGEHHLIQYKDSDIQVKMQLVKTNTKRHFVISLIVYLNVCFVNKHFSRDY